MIPFQWLVSNMYRAYRNFKPPTTLTQRTETTESRLYLVILSEICVECNVSSTPKQGNGKPGGAKTQKT